MTAIAVFVDDAGYAIEQLSPLLPGRAAPARWVIVGCAPKLTHRIGKWVSHRNREHWREHWARTLRERLEPLFSTLPGEREWLLAREPLPELAERLRRRLGADLRLVDLRRPRLDAAAAGLAADAPGGARWAAGVAVAGSLATALALGD